MNIRAHKSQSKRHPSVTKQTLPIQNRRVTDFQIMDNRSGAIAQRNLQVMTNNSPRVSQLTIYQNMANNYAAENRYSAIQRMPDQTHFPAAIHAGQQSKHDGDSKNYINQMDSGIYKSIIKPQRAQELLDSFRNSLPDGENPVPEENWPATVILENTAKKRVIVDYGQYVGNIIDENSGTDLGASTKGSISYGAKPHMYPIE